MITQTKLVTGTLAAGLALAACGSVAGTSGRETMGSRSRSTRCSAADHESMK